VHVHIGNPTVGEHPADERFELVAVDDVGLEHEMVGVVGAHGEEPAAELFR
jgi:hypothetical protein